MKENLDPAIVKLVNLRQSLAVSTTLFGSVTAQQRRSNSVGQ